ncbi:MAG: hypothetical protein GTO46_05520 [Gemmatimonadetes bacterium]|nr:hypothetical protein [Gemmatimonadota bacterium]NIO31088.1 hypothetical protein [Gemmatimonadota bacterium]
MDPDRKAKMARILGYVCVAVGALNLVLAGILALRGQTPVRWPLVGTGFGALTGGIIMLTLGYQRPKPGG